MEDKKKRIGIVTIHMMNNFGAVLQAYALNSYLNSVGYDAETIDFRTHRVERSYNFYARVRRPTDLIRNFQSWVYLNKTKMRKKRMLGFVRDNIKLSKDVYYSNAELNNADLDYDYYICGSDQIWNTFCDNYDDAFLLAFAREKGMRLSYAASLGMSSVHPDLVQKFKDELSDFTALSVREKSAVDLISSISGKKTVQVLDPVFLLTREQWEKVMRDDKKPTKPYILFYSVHGGSSSMREHVRALSKRYHLPIVVVYKNLRESFYQNIKRYDAGPAEFVSLISGAEYVFTNSFHGCALSILFRKNFQVYVDGTPSQGTSSRIYSLMDTLGLADRIAFSDSDPSSMGKEIDWNAVDEKLSPMIEFSKAYLDEALRTE